MKVALLGTSYKIASIKELEQINLDDALIQDLYTCKHTMGIQELTILSTCNRFEYYFVSDDIQASMAQIKAYIVAHKQISLETVNAIFSEKQNQDAIRHILHVAAGIESMVLGENEILGQLKDAMQKSLDTKSSGSILNKVFQLAISCGKKSRTHTDIAKGSYSVTSIAIEGIRQRIPDYLNKTILIIGAGTMGIRAIKKLHALGHKHTMITNRTDQKAQQLSRDYHAAYIPYKRLTQAIPTADIIISATRSKDYTLTAANIQPIDKAKLYIDLGLPRNIDPTMDQLYRITVLTLTNIEKIANKTLADRRDQIPQIKQLIEEDIQKLTKWYIYKTTT